MMPLRLALSAMLLVLLTFSTGSCSHTAQVPVAVPSAKCPTSPRPVPPRLDATASPDGQYVQIPWPNARDLGLYIADSSRWMQLAEVCLDSREAPLSLRAAPDDYGVGALLKSMRVKGVDVTVKWITCGEVNAFYSPTHREIWLCKELRELDPAVVRFIAAHEMAHAIITQRDIPFTGLHEAAADELAMYAVWNANLMADLPTVAKFWRDLGDTWHHPSDVHPSNGQRYWAVQRFMGSKLERWRIVTTWIRLLDLPPL